MEHLQPRLPPTRRDLQHSDAGNTCLPPHVLLQAVDANDRRIDGEGRHLPGSETRNLLSNDGGPRQIKTSAPRPIVLGIPRQFPDLPLTPLSPSSSLMGSTRSPSPDYSYGQAASPAGGLLSLDGVIGVSRPSAALSREPRTRTPSHSRQSMSMDSAVVLEMDNMSVAAEEKIDDEALDDAYEPFGYQHVRDSAVDLPRDLAVDRVERRLANVTLEDLTTSSRQAVPVFPDEEASDDDTCTVVSDDGVTRETDKVLAFSLPAVVGIQAEDLDPETISRCQMLTASYVQELSRIVEHSINSGPADLHTEQQIDAAGPGSGQSGNDFSRSNSQSSSEKSNRGRNPRKRRKSSTGRDNDNEDDDDLDVDGSYHSRQKRANTGLRLRCIFRARNPIKFNVRDHHSCAMSYFTTFADLRQHIIKKHSREDPLEFACLRCNMSFKTKKELIGHTRVPESQVCQVADIDPEDGVDSTTAKRIVDRRRTPSGPTDQHQWNDLWALVFPDDDASEVPPYEFQAVVEHFELEATYIESLQYLQPCLQGLGLPLTNEVMLALCDRILENFHMTMNKWNIRAREMDYVNRQGSRNSGLRSSLATLAELPPARDSGVFLESETSRFSSFIQPAVGTPASSCEPLARSSTGSDRGSQGYLTRRPSSGMFQQPRPVSLAPQHSTEMVQAISRSIRDIPESPLPASFPPHDAAALQSHHMIPNYQQQLGMQDGGGFDARHTQFMGLGSTFNSGDFAPAFYGNGAMSYPYHLHHPGPAVTPNFPAPQQGLPGMELGVLGRHDAVDGSGPNVV